MIQIAYNADLPFCGTGREIRASFGREGGASVNGLDTVPFYLVSFAPRILKQSCSLFCSVVEF